jgi:3-phenylpropionate/cinnamic acid dioxygenase small subunit
MIVAEADRAVQAARFEPEAFLFEEARMLDEGDFERWLDLFTEDGRYWVPAIWQQDDPLNSVSIHYEDRALLKVRIMRLRHPRTENMRPAPRTIHNISNVVMTGLDEHAGRCVLHSNLLYVEYRLDQQRVIAGRCRHELRRIDGQWRIALKRVDLLNCDSESGFVRFTIPF